MKKLASDLQNHLFRRRRKTCTNSQLESTLLEELTKLKEVVQSREAELVNDHAEQETTQKALQALMQEKESLLQEQVQLEQRLEESKEAFEQVYQIQNENENLKQLLEQMKQELDQLESANQLQIDVPKVRHTPHYMLMVVYFAWSLTITLRLSAATRYLASRAKYTYSG